MRMELRLLCAGLALVGLLGCGWQQVKPEAPNGSSTVDSTPPFEPTGGELVRLAAQADGALVHLVVSLEDDPTPRPGTAFVVARRGGEIYLLTARHLLHPEGGKKGVSKVVLTGAGVDATLSDPAAAEFDLHTEEDLALLHVAGKNEGPILRLGAPDLTRPDLSDALALGFAAGGDANRAERRRGLLSVAQRGAAQALVIGTPIAPGMDGGPLVSCATGLVLGVIGESDEGADKALGRRAAPLLPIALYLQAYADIKLQRQAPVSHPRDFLLTYVERPKEQSEILAALHPVAASARATVAEARTGAAAGAAGGADAGAAARQPASVSAPSVGLSAPPFVLLTGGPGTGKTSLARRVAWEEFYKGNYPDGVWFFAIADKSADQVLLEIAEAANGGPVEPMPTSKLVKLLQGRLTDRQVLIVLDDLRGDSIPDTVLQAVARTSVLATSRNRYNHSRITKRLEIGRMIHGEAVKLLRQETAPTPVDDAMADQICNQVGDVAEAVHLAAGALRQSHGTAAEYLARLRSSPCATMTKDERELAICPPLQTSWQVLDTNAHEMLVALAQAGEAPIPTALAAGLVGGQLAEATLDALTQRRFVSRVGGTIQIHSQVVAWARRHWTSASPKVAQRAREGLIKWIVDKAANTTAATWSQEEDMGTHLGEAQRVALAEQKFEDVARIAAAWNDPLDRLGEWAILADLWQRAADAGRQQGADGRGKLAVALSQLGLCRQKAGDPAAAKQKYEESLALAKAVGDKSAAATSLRRLGTIALQAGEPTSAKQKCEESLALVRELKDRAGIALSLHQLGMVAQTAGDRTGAKQRYEESLPIAKEVGDRTTAAASLHQLGILAQEAGDSVTAKQRYEDSVAIAKDGGDRTAVALSLHNLGAIVLSAGDPAAAKQKYEESLAISKERGDRTAMAKALHQLGMVAQDAGNYGAAVQRYEESLALDRELGDKNGISKSLHNLGMVMQDTGDYTGAKLNYEESLAVARELGDRMGIARSLHQLGMVAQLTGDNAAAKQRYEESLAIKKELRDRSGIAISLGQLGQLAAATGDRATARARAVEALRMMKQLGRESGAYGRVLWLMARVEQAGSRPAEARRWAEQAVAMLQRLHDPAADEASSFLASLAKPKAQEPKSRARRRQVSPP